MSFLWFSKKLPSVEFRVYAALLANDTLCGKPRWNTSGLAISTFIGLHGKDAAYLPAHKAAASASIIPVTRAAIRDCSEA